MRSFHALRTKNAIIIIIIIIIIITQSIFTIGFTRGSLKIGFITDYAFISCIENKECNNNNNNNNNNKHSLFLRLGLHEDLLKSVL